VPDFGDWTNCVRGYVTHGERGHITVSYPDGVPEHPAPYWSEVWTGAEYLYAAALALHGAPDRAQDAVLAVRERFTGARRNPFDEAECGHHYARALASWGVLVALTGFSYDARSGVMTFAASPHPVTWFWSAGSAWGTVRQDFTGSGSGSGSGERTVTLDVLHGSIRVDRVLVR
jgi:non-lysosomal glucosylceramidase